ncbi:hypothetical protein FN846DRAFT_780004 [Sphaerosporella brunnea]|uniref:Ubiquinone biosynthesis monooxygenase COQ6, mitochondrial n=1 Tax=Sphaerosporella brunnea TaxID=1250544 RepID=A0A5J5EUD0_9PEZI|nr:hypothetical protein FN846DRAFT_780004 [Sphaerosporella brunnea]
MQSIRPLRSSITTLRLVRRSRTYATTSRSDADLYDVVIVGGGPAGLSLASSLRSSSVTNGLRVALIESLDLEPTRKWNPAPGTYSNRVSSLTPGSAGFLQDIGVWEHVKRDRVQAYKGMKVWDGVSGSRITFDADLQDGASTIAYMCENNNLTSSLLSRISQLGEGIDILDKTRVEKISYGEDTGELDLRSWPVVTVSSGKQLAARLLVGADGANSPVRTFADIESRGWDYGRHGVVATLNLSEEQLGEKTAFQRFLPTGPVAMLPLPGPHASLVWSTTPENAVALKSMSPTDFAAMVNAAFRLSHVDLDYIFANVKTGIANEVAWREKNTAFDPWRVPATVTGVQEKTVASFPLKMRHADSYISERVALIGDAAHTVHPLAGQGLNQGIGDVRSLIKALEYAVQHGQDIGSVLSLEPYYSEQYLKNHVMLGVVDKLHKLYATTSAPVVVARSLGLDLVDKLGPLKKFFMAQAAGR